MSRVFVNLYDLCLVSVYLSPTSLYMYLDFSYTEVSKMGNMLIREGEKSVKNQHVLSVCNPSFKILFATVAGYRIADR